MEQIFYKAAQIVSELVWCIVCDWLRLMLHVDIFDGRYIISALILSHKGSQKLWYRWIVNVSNDNLVLSWLIFVFALCF